MRTLTLTLLVVLSLIACAPPAAQPPAAAEPTTLTLEVSGMTCAGCEQSIAASVKKIDGVREVTADHKAGKAVVKFDPARARAADIRHAIEKAGYRIEG
jgi:copper ion binding protein